ncbi:ABC transporter permease [Lysinibacter sp. HNR]|uniref:ABC transporter permease n=1 Tax=Lysinibacter sp. HNR TaxID=3031408 RepID=UPI002434E3D9|nr:ABC transporter permease [Lysinibacter sp. HNR]WGD37292.1 ABC transporter permease [Lysinibacter sp. HNR]
MLAFVSKRLLSGIVLLAVISALTFMLVFSSGSNIARNLLGDYATNEQVAAKSSELGLDQPILGQLLGWFAGVIRGDFGISWFTSEPVAQAILNRLPVTLTIVTIVIVLSAIFSVVIGMAAAVRRGWIDRAVQVLAVGGYAIPSFIVAIVLVTLFAIQLKLLPATGFVPFHENVGGWALSLILPVAALTLSTVASTAQQVRSSLLEVLRRDYVRTLTSRGLGRGEILVKHVLRSAAPPALTVLALQFVGLLGGAVIVEQIFALPGIGYLAVESTLKGDLPVVLGVVFFTVCMVIVVNLMIDLVIGWLNPKVRV